MKIKHPQNYISQHQRLTNEKLNDLVDRFAVLSNLATEETLLNVNSNIQNISIDSSNIASELTLQGVNSNINLINDKIPSIGPNPSASSISVIPSSSGFIAQTRADEEENTAKSNSHLIAIAGYRDNTRTVANQRFGALAINNNGQLEVDIINNSVNVDSNTLATETKQDNTITKLTDIENKLNAVLNTNDIIRIKRDEDKCYGITVNGGATASTDADFILWNPSGSGVNLYVYHLSYSFVGTVSSAGQRKIGVELINAFTASGGLALGPVEMKFNTTANTNQAICYYSGNTSTRWRSLQDNYFYCDTTKNNFHIDLKLETDILEIAEGLGLRIQQDGTPDAGMRLNTQIRWYEE